MAASAIIFYIIAACMLVTGFMSVTSRKIFRSAIWLLFSLVSIAALYFWMQVEFIAAVQIIVYVGGIVVLIIFSIFLTQQAGSEMPKARVARVTWSALAVVFGILFTAVLLWRHFTNDPVASPDFNVSMPQIGEQLLSVTDYGYILPFEAVSMLLLAAMIGCIVIAMRSKPGQIVSPVNLPES